MPSVPSRGQVGALDLLARMLTQVQDPVGAGVGAEITELPSGVNALIHMPSGDRYRVTVVWEGDTEDDDAG